jgi:hypothetical protein
MLGGHQYQFPPTMPRDFHRLTLRLVLNLPEITLELDSRCLSSHESLQKQIICILQIIWIRVNASTAAPPVISFLVNELQSCSVPLWQLGDPAAAIDPSQMSYFDCGEARSVSDFAIPAR